MKDNEPIIIGEETTYGTNPTEEDIKNIKPTRDA